jgi:hypothetical protein
MLDRPAEYAYEAAASAKSAWSAASVKAAVRQDSSLVSGGHDG